jgi:hypothetical protein
VPLLDCRSVCVRPFVTPQTRHNQTSELDLSISKLISLYEIMPYEMHAYIGMRLVYYYKDELVVKLPVS